MAISNNLERNGTMLYLLVITLFASCVHFAEPHCLASSATNPPTKFSASTQGAEDEDLQYFRRFDSSLNMPGIKKSEDVLILNLKNCNFPQSEIYRLRRFNNVEALILSSNFLQHSELRHLEQLNELRLLDLTNTGICDKDLLDLKPLRKLKLLYLDDNNIGEFGGLSSLDKMVELSILSLDRTKITDLDFVGLNQLRMLTELSVQRTNVKGYFLKHLSSSKRLRVLNLSHNCGLSDVVGEHLKNFSQINNIDFSYCNITNKFMNEIGFLKNLDTLILRGTAVDDTGIQLVKELLKLRVLDIEQTQVTDIGVDSISKHKGITTLRLGKTRITNKSIDCITKMESIKNIDMNNTIVDDVGALKLLELNDVLYLNLEGTRVSRAVVNRLRNHFKKGEVQSEKGGTSPPA